MGQRRLSKVLPGRSLGIGSQGAQKGDRQWLLKGQATRHDLPEDARQIIIGQGTGVALLYGTQYLGFPLGAVENWPSGNLFLYRRQLDFGDLLGTAGAVTDQTDQLAVDGVNAGPDAGEVLVSSHILAVALLELVHKLA